MSFLLPWAFLGLLSLPLLMAIYMLRRRYRPMIVSAIFLWQTPGLRSGGGYRISRLEQSLLLLLELLIAACLVMAAAAPGCRRLRHLQRIVVILDDSASMLADSQPGTGVVPAASSIPETSPRQRAEQWLIDYLHNHRPYITDLIISGNNPRLAGIAMDNPRDLRAAIKQWVPEKSLHDLAPSILMARQLAGKNGKIIFLTDHAPPESEGNGSPPRPTDVEWRAFGKKLANSAIISAGRTVDQIAGKEEIFVMLASYPARSETEIILHDDENRKLASSVLKMRPMPGGASEAFGTFSIDRSNHTPLQLRIKDGGALKIDDSVFLVPEKQMPLRVKWAWTEKHAESRTAKLFKRTFDAMGKEVIFVKDRPQLIIGDAAANDPDAGNPEYEPWLMECRLPEKDDVIRRFIGPYVVATADPLCRDLSLTGIRWAIGEHACGDDTVIPLISVGDYNLLVEVPGNAPVRKFRIAFHLAESNFQKTPAWPILMHKLVRARTRVKPGFSTHNFRSGETAVYFSEPQAPREQNVRIRHFSPADSQGTEIMERFHGREWRYSTERPGISELRFESQKDNSTHRLAFNLMSPDESDLRNSQTGTWGETPASAKLTATWRDEAWIFLMAALSLAIIHLFLLSKKTGAAT